MKYVAAIEIPEGAQEDIFVRYALPSDPETAFEYMKVIYVFDRFKAWVNENVTGGIAEVFDLRATSENMEVFMQFNSKAEVEAFIAEFGLDNEYMVVEEA